VVSFVEPAGEALIRGDLEETALTLVMILTNRLPVRGYWKKRPKRGLVYVAKGAVGAGLGVGEAVGGLGEAWGNPQFDSPFCDRVSFDFCFKRPARGRVLVYPRNDTEEELSLQYEIHAGEITISPWPLNVEKIGGYLIGYHADGYPNRLEPVLLPYHIRPRD